MLLVLCHGSFGVTIMTLSFTQRDFRTNYTLAPRTAKISVLITSSPAPE